MAAAAIKEICLLVNWNIYGFFLVKLSAYRFSLGLIPDIFGQIRHLDVSPNKILFNCFRAMRCPPNAFGVQPSCQFLCVEQNIVILGDSHKTRVKINRSPNKCHPQPTSVTLPSQLGIEEEKASNDQYWRALVFRFLRPWGVWQNASQ